MSRNWKLFLISLLALFLELFLIRWISTEIRVFAYINNFVLLACFMGLGMGSAYSRRRIELILCLAMVTLLVLMTRANPFINLTEALNAFEDSVIWAVALRDGTWLGSITSLLLVFYLFMNIALCFVPIGQKIGRLFEDHPRIILAYSVNLLGSLAGIWLFSALSFFSVPPLGWLAVSIALLLILLPRNRTQLSVFLGLSVLAGIMVAGPPSTGQNQDVWSPYQKLTLRPIRVGRGQTRNYQVRVNNTGYMGLNDLSDAFFADNSRFDVEYREIQHYVFPYLLRPKWNSVLIAGAGGGNDAAAALRNGVEHIDAVEIDPIIFEFGRDVHPERPYQDARVTLHIDDARSYFKTTDRKYDMVRLGLLDSHSKASNNNNLRLDHYVYTRQSLSEIRDLLTPDGILSLSFAAQRVWVIEKLHDLIAEEFGKQPLVIEFSPPNERVYGHGGYLFLVGNGDVDVQALFRANPSLVARVEKSPAATILHMKRTSGLELPTDDWPYLYLEKPEVPTLFLLVMASLALLLVPLSRVLVTQGEPFEWKFFFLGAAFLLLEFQNVSKASLIFGATWMVNAYIFSGILSVILLANLAVAWRRNWNIGALYAALVASLLCLYWTPLDVFNQLPLALKSTAVVLLMNLPVFFAGILFIIFFEQSQNKKMAYGSNLLGSAAGGVLESLSFIVGIKALLLVVMGFYLASFFFHRRSRADAG